MSGDATFPGLFNDRLHRVATADLDVFEADGRRFAAAACGVPCVPAKPQPGRSLCRKCFPSWPES